MIDMLRIFFAKFQILLSLILLYMSICVKPLNLSSISYHLQPKPINWQLIAISNSLKINNCNKLIVLIDN